jgi:FAD/FMN-containing dehydrogenase
VIEATSWGRYPRAVSLRQQALQDRHAALPAAEGHGLLAHGMGRSYGDVGLNDGGVLLRTSGLDRYIFFDEATGVLRAEAGVTLDDILSLVVPRGWFLAVTPGTRFVSLGGAVANDVHGKNHHVAGSFGDHVRGLELLRSDGERLLCSAGSNAEWLQATIGGLGLTGLITWVEIQLVRINHPGVWTVNRKFGGLDEYWAIDAELGASHDYAVAWVDCLNGARGIYNAANFAGNGETPPPTPKQAKRMPIDPPWSLINGPTLRAFNALYYHRPVPERALVHYQPFFYPLDAIAQWNRIYGRRGFFQYQCVLPPDVMRDASAELFRLIGKSGLGSFLAVFKTFGDSPAPGLMSFPRPGATLALDFPNAGVGTLRLMDQLDAVVGEARGALYSAKDARMPPWLFAQSYPNLEQFTRFIDPAFSSSFWRRVTAPSSLSQETTPP